MRWQMLKVSKPGKFCDFIVSCDLEINSFEGNEQLREDEGSGW